MRVFVTGASGHIASAVIPELLDNGHEVVGLARSDESAEAVAALGAEVHRGDLDDLDGLRAAAAESDGVIHLAFKHEAMLTGDFMSAVDSDMAAHRAIGEGLIGTDKPFVTTGGTLMLAMAGITGRPGTEDDQSDAGPRVDAANYTISLAQQGVRSAVIRLAPMVHSDLDHHGFTHALIGFARDNGVAAYTEDGSNRWPAANTHDIGVLYRLALEKAPAGSTFHGVGDTGLPRQGDRRDDRGQARGRDQEHHHGGGAAVPRLSRRLRRPGQPDLERQDARGAGLGADPSGLGRGRGDGQLLRLTAHQVPLAGHGSSPGSHQATVWPRQSTYWPGAIAAAAFGAVAVAGGTAVGTVGLVRRDVAIRGDTINLGQLLKLEGVIGSGAEVKTLLSTESVSVNGEPEARRGRKLHLDDVVRVGELELRVIAASP